MITNFYIDGFNLYYCAVRDNKYEQAVIVSNDADFAGAMRFVKEDLCLRVKLVNPDPRNRSPRDLVDSATYVKRIWPSNLRPSQFPDKLTDMTDNITKPPSW